MKRKTKNGNNPVKDVKKAMYRSKSGNFKLMLILMLIGGIVAAGVYFCHHAFMDYAASSVHIVLSYPEIAASQYPDGSRFTYRDFVNDDRLQEALDVMHENGKYENFEVADIRDAFQVTGYLSSSASTNVSTARSEGNDYSYVANEYKITFTQPHDFRQEGLLEKLINEDNSGEFLQVLVAVNQRYFAEVKGGIDGFRMISTLDDIDAYDYDETVGIYRTKTRAIANYLRNLDNQAPKFKDKETNLSVKDVKSKYDLIITNKLDAISDYIDTTGASKNREVTSNKIRVNIENTELKHKKAIDHAAITEYAMVHYDHTFTENLINVVRDKTQGLYQARPKTAFDTVVVRMNDSREEVSEYAETLLELNQDLQRFSRGPAATVQAATPVVEAVEEVAAADAAEPAKAEEAAPAEAAPAPAAPVVTVSAEEAAQKCDQLFAGLQSEYDTVTEEARTVVDHCLRQTNKNYISGEISAKSLINQGSIVKTGIAFMIGALVMFFVYVYFSIASDRRKLKRRQKILSNIKKQGKEGKQ